MVVILHLFTFIPQLLQHIGIGIFLPICSVMNILIIYKLWFCIHMYGYLQKFHFLGSFFHLVSQMFCSLYCSPDHAICAMHKLGENPPDQPNYC